MYVYLEKHARKMIKNLIMRENVLEKSEIGDKAETSI